LESPADILRINDNTIAVSTYNYVEFFDNEGNDSTEYARLELYELGDSYFEAYFMKRLNENELLVTGRDGNDWGKFTKSVWTGVAHQS